MLSKYYCCEIQIRGNEMIKFPGMDKSGRILSGMLWLKNRAVLKMIMMSLNIRHIKKGFK
jgi:hypothetical protein